MFAIVLCPSTLEASTNTCCASVLEVCILVPCAIAVQIPSALLGHMSDAQQGNADLSQLLAVLQRLQDLQAARNRALEWVAQGLAKVYDDAAAACKAAETCQGEAAERQQLVRRAQQCIAAARGHGTLLVSTAASWDSHSRGRSQAALVASSEALSLLQKRLNAVKAQCGLPVPAKQWLLSVEAIERACVCKAMAGSRASASSINVHVCCVCSSSASASASSSSSASASASASAGSNSSVLQARQLPCTGGALYTMRRCSKRPADPEWTPNKR